MSTAIRSFLLFVVTTLGVSSSLLAESERPNILFVLTDDQGWPTLGSYGGKRVPTPHLDRLASEGALFSDFYVTSQCSPTRASFMTGQYTARHRLWHVLPWYGYPWARVAEAPFAENFPREKFTIAKGLQEAGYATAIVGKWHLTANEDGTYLGLEPEASHYYGFDYAPPLLPPSEFKEGNDRGVDELTDQAIAFISKNRDRPWFCFLSHHMIHGKVYAPSALTDRYRGMGYGDEGPNRAVYLAGLEHIDHSIGRLMQALQSMGEADDTIVIFTSDNGGVDEKFDFNTATSEAGTLPKLSISTREYDNAPLRMGKGSVYEGGIRVPFIIRWPGRITPGQRIEAPAHIVDMAPTFFAVAGAKPPEGHVLDGENLWELLDGDSKGRFATRPIFQYYPFYDLRWGLTPSASIRAGEYKLIEFFGDRVDDGGQLHEDSLLELYNLRTDIGETDNLALANPELASRLRKRLHDWIAAVGCEVPQTNLHFSPERRLEETREKPSWLMRN